MVLKLKKNKMLQVTLVRSTIGIPPKQKACVRTLGLRRIRHTVVVDDNLCMRGVINKVSYLLSVKEV